MVMTMKQKVLGCSSLILCTIILGSSFVAQSVGMVRLGPFTFQAIRCLLAILFLFFCTTCLDLKATGLRGSLAKWKDPLLMKNGLICGGVLFIAASLQQIGLVYADAGKAGFLTSVYIILVPLIGLFVGKPPSAAALISVVPATVGLVLLSGIGFTGINIGDLFLMGGATGFAVHILLIHRTAGMVDSLRFNCVQCLVIAGLSLPFLLTEPLSLQDIWACRVPLIFSGVFSMGLAYSLQVVGQKYVEPTAASLLRSLEAVFAALGGWLILHETMNGRELAGCALMFLAVIVSQLPLRFPRLCAAEDGEISL